MVKKLLKNKFFILFFSFVIVVIVARFSPVYSLNDRLIVLSLGIQCQQNELLITIEAIKPNKQNEQYIKLFASGKSVTEAINNIEKKHNKKVSLAQTEIVFLQKDLIAKNGLQFLQSDRLKKLPEIAVNVVCDNPNHIIGNKIENQSRPSFMLGTSIRQSDNDLDILQVNNKDLGRDYLSHLGCVVMPYLTITSEQDIIESEDIINGGGKLLSLGYNQGYCFNKHNSMVLGGDDFLAYLLLCANNNKMQGMVSFVIDSINTASIFIKNVAVKHNYILKNANYVAQHVVNISICDDESFIMQHNEQNKRHDITKKDLTSIQNKVQESCFDMLNKAGQKNIDVLHTYDKFYAKYHNKVATKTDFVSKLKNEIIINFSFFNGK